MRKYYGVTYSEDFKMRTIYATVTGEMSDGTLVYTEIETKDGAIVTENGEPKLILENQYTRTLRRGTQTFERL